MTVDAIVSCLFDLTKVSFGLMLFVVGLKLIKDQKEESLNE